MEMLIPAVGKMMGNSRMGKTGFWIRGLFYYPTIITPFPIHKSLVFCFDSSPDFFHMFKDGWIKG